MEYRDEGFTVKQKEFNKLGSKKWVPHIKRQHRENESKLLINRPRVSVCKSIFIGKFFKYMY